MSDGHDIMDEQPAPARKFLLVLKRFLPFVLFIAVGLLVVEYTPHGEKLSEENLERFAQQLGVVRGLVYILLAGILTPLIFFPRWPVAFIAGVFYGVFLGALIATVASTAGAWLHYQLSRNLMSSLSDRLIHKYKLHRFRVPPHREFSAIFFLRAFPLGYFPATNLLAGMLRMNQRKYLLASFLGMMPTSLLWAAGGKLLKNPSPSFYAMAAAALVLMIVGTMYAEKKISAWQQGRNDDSPIVQ